MAISFRTRLFVMASLIVASVLSLVLFIGWSRVLAFEVERLDDRLCIEARGLHSKQPRGDAPRRDFSLDAARAEADIANKLRVESRTQLMLSIGSSNGPANFQSTRGSYEVNFDELAWARAGGVEMRVPRDLRERERGRPAPPDRPPPPSGGDADRPRPGARADRPPPSDCAVAPFAIKDGQWRAARIGSDAERVIVAVDLAATKNELNSALQQALILVVPIALLLTALGAWLLASLTMRPVNRLREAMKGMSKNALEQRLPVAGEDREFKDLIVAYNTMLARLEASFKQASRFSADAAHELKTPLTILQGRLEQAISAPDSGAPPLDLIAMQEEVRRLASVTRKLLFLSQADAGRMATHRSTVDLTDMLDELVASAHMVMTHQAIKNDIERALSIQGDAQLLKQLFNNLLSNATQYCKPQGWIDISAKRTASGIDVVFANATDMIPATERQRFFERFYRGDPSHHRAVDGSGLGLSLAREIVRAHGGEMTLEASALDQVRLRIHLPLAHAMR